jgi:hypothetical protein
MHLKNSALKGVAPGIRSGFARLCVPGLVCVLAASGAVAEAAHFSGAPMPGGFSERRQPPPAVHRPAPVERRPPPVANATRGAAAGANQHLEAGQHLGQWMQSHRNLSLAQQHQALDAEPGFRNLSPEVQQRLHQRLTQLNNMTPEARARMIARNEAIERLMPAQRQQIRDAMAQLGSLPEARQHIVARTFYLLRDMPYPQRMAYMNSPQFRLQFNYQERATIDRLFSIAPIWPPLQGGPR